MAPTGRRRAANTVLWGLRVASPGFVALEPAIKAELVVEEQEALEAREGDLDPERPDDPYRVREVKFE